MALGGLLLVGCVGPHSSGGLWAQQNLEQEAALFRLSDAELAQRARAYELGLADQALAAERSRITGELQDCPGTTRQQLVVSAGDRVRDTIRLRVQGDSARLASLAQVALADWRLRRARASGEARQCDDARSGLAGSIASSSSRSNVLEQLGVATVSRGAGPPNAAVRDSHDPTEVMSLYASGWADSVTAQAPLPQYLAAVYGGAIVASSTPRTLLNGRTAESVVDELAPAYPDWEPDALFAALSAS